MSIKLVAAHALAIVVLTSSMFCQTYTSVSYSYAPIQFPGAPLTVANGINNHNVIVGSFFDSNYSVHGFVYRQGTYTRIDYPGSTETEVLGVNDDGDLVGTYQVPGPLNFHGFLWQDGRFLSIDAPEAQFGTKVFGINRARTMVGSFDDSQGFIFKEGVFTVFNAPQLPGEQSMTQLNGINNLGWISGQVFSAGTWRGFWLKGDDIDFLERPGSSDNQVTGMNARGDIVGCHDATLGFAAFQVENREGREANETFPQQQKLASCASGINNQRVVVGNYFKVNNPAAFVGVPQLTLNAVGPQDHSVVRTPVELSASASGLNPIKEIQVWVNSVKVAYSKESKLNKKVALPTGANQRVVLQAIDSKGSTTRIVLMLTVD